MIRKKPAPTDREVSRAYEPYRREALYSFVMSILAMVCCTVVIIPWGIEIPGVFLVLGVGYLCILLLEAVFIFRWALLSVIEKRRGCYACAQVQMVRISEEFVPSGKYESVVGKLYPKELRVRRHIIKCVDADGNRLTLRSVMSGKNAQPLLDEIYYKTGKTRTVLYGKYTHIIVKYCDDDDTSLTERRMRIWCVNLKDLIRNDAAGGIRRKCFPMTE